MLCFQRAALEKLLSVMPTHWAEIADVLVEIEELAEDVDSENHELAAAVASRCFYHLEEYSDALRLALGSGSYFDLNDKSEYTETIVSRCIDEYIKIRRKPVREGEAAEDVDARLVEVIERVFRQCFDDGEWTQAIGIAIEARRLDIVERAVEQATRVDPSNRARLLAFVYDVGHGAATAGAATFRRELLTAVAEAHKTTVPPNRVSHMKCLQALGDAGGAAAVLVTLIRAGAGVAEGADPGADASIVMAHQLAFDMVENDDQKYLQNVLRALPTKPDAAAAAAAAGDGAAAAAAAAADGGGDAAAGEDDADKGQSAAAAADAPGDAADASGGDDGDDGAFYDELERLRGILSGSVSVKLNVQFLHAYCHADKLILANIQKSATSSVLHQATIVAHGFMYAGTAFEKFLTQNSAWVRKATNWAKFSVVASKGAIHKGRLEQSRQILEPHLPRLGEVMRSPYEEGGALYALGLIHANRGAGSGVGDGGVLNFLSTALRDTHNEVIQHGACLGIGLAGMSSGNDQLYAQMREILYQESASAGEAAGFGIGLLLLGRGLAWSSAITGENAVAELLTYAGDTDHEKTIRGIALGLAFVCFGLESEADVLTSTLVRHKDAVMRYGGMFALAMAYAGTGNNGAIRQLLHVAVSDVSNDVRRAAVMCLGFLLFRQPETVPRLVSLLAESYNPHVRYGACMAMGIACAGTGLSDAVSLLLPMVDDSVDFVRQGALIALAMVLINVSEHDTPSVKTVRDKFAAVVVDKRANTMTRLGAVIGQGIIDGGGRNCTVSMSSGAGFTKMSSVVGIAMFVQYWYWFPLFHFLSLSFTPTAMIGLRRDHKIPKSFRIECACPKSWFAYPEFLTEEKAESKKRVTTAQLSVTARANAKAKKRASAKSAAAAGGKTEDGAGDGSGSAAADGGDSAAASGGDGDGGDGDGDGGASAAAAASGDGGGAAAGAEESESKKVSFAEEKPTEEPKMHYIQNPCRVTSAQRKYLKFPTAESIAAANAGSSGASSTAAAAPAAAGAAGAGAAGASASASASGDDSDGPGSQRWLPVAGIGKRHNLGVVMLLDATPNVPVPDSDLIAIKGFAVGAEDADGPEPEPPEPFEWMPPDEENNDI